MLFRSWCMGEAHAGVVLDALANRYSVTVDTVELRVPLVDARLHACLAAAGFQPARRLGKAALVRRLAPELPAALWRRPKTGFYVPVLEWLRPGELGPAGHGLGGRSRALARLVLAELGIPLSGQDGDKVVLNRIAKGQQTVTVWKNSYNLGQAAAKAAIDRKSTRLNSSHRSLSRMPSSA